MELIKIKNPGKSVLIVPRPDGEPDLKIEAGGVVSSPRFGLLNRLIQNGDLQEMTDIGNGSKKSKAVPIISDVRRKTCDAFSESTGKRCARWATTGMDYCSAHNRKQGA